ncbi:MAG TPA: cation-translocating P-type ATPase [Burkholderiales bacterium]|nr:cation-translocating P-type ATPase [Burkholderiales bacterium]
MRQRGNPMDDGGNVTLTPPGLGSEEAKRRLTAEGANTLPGADRRTVFSIALEVMREPMFLLLVAGALIYVVLGDVREAAILAASIVVVITITVTQERKSERALEALRDLSSPRALVVRDGAPLRIAGTDVVRGDLMILAEGDRVPADARLTVANELMVDESLLTGESLPVEKRTGMPVYSGTLVVKGQGRAEVTATGARTEFGRIGSSLATLEMEKTPLQKGSARIVKAIAVAGLAACVLVATYYGAVRGDWLGGILAGITLAMAALPEEIPVVLTVFLALGAWRIARHGVLTRRMPAIETLGSATVLCADKTGTLTENRMAVVDTIAPGGDAARTLHAAALACEMEPFDPMERAILSAAGREVHEQRRSWTLEHDYPMTPDFLAVCHAWRSPGGERRAAIKGAPETVLALCHLDEAALRSATAEVERASKRGLRLLAVAEAPWGGAQWPADPREYSFEWLGFVALADPLRAGVAEAIALCRSAGVRVVMITGDYPGTALAIARQAGIAVEGGVLTGADIAAMGDAARAQAVQRVNVFARIRPEQKLQLITAYKAAGEVVAMTGDGVNDAPALKAAHIGVAMGRRGTDVAREASALVLLEDDFNSIVRTVQRGRTIYENIRNAMRYIIAVHVPTVGMALLPLAFGWPVFLYPVHIVFLEFVIDPACSIVFEAEESDESVMRRPPRDPAEPLFSLQMLWVSMVLGTSMLAVVALAYAWIAESGAPAGEVRSFGFAAIVFGNLALIHATRSRDRLIVDTLRLPNRALWWITGGALAALAASIYMPPVADIFRFAPLAVGDFALAALAGIAGIAWYEVYKLLRPRRAAA